MADESRLRAGCLARDGRPFPFYAQVEAAGKKIDGGPAIVKKDKTLYLQTQKKIKP